MHVFIDDQHPSSGSISVFLITKYNIDSVLSLYHITIYLYIILYLYITAALNNWTDFYQIYICCALHLHDFTYQIWKKSVQ